MPHKKEIVKRKEKELKEIETIVSQIGTWSHEEVIGALRDFAREIVRELAELREKNITHELTGLTNRRFSDFFLKREFGRIKRYGGRLSIILIDLDELKFINDHYGYLEGDHALIKLANIIKSQIRESDVACHWGGDEFLIVCPGINAKQAEIIVERIKKMIKNTKIKDEKGLTISSGVTEVRGEDRSIKELFHRANEILRQEKKRKKATIEQ